MTQIAELLRRRVQTNGAEPLITYYDLGSGERTELSAISFRNWVDKTSNLLVDEYQLEVGEVVALPLALEAPAHWVTLVWATACWQVGAVVDLAGSAEPPRLRVLGPSQVAALPPDELAATGQTELVGCSLHPLGLGFPERLPHPMADYTLEVRSQPDIHAAGQVPDDADAWRDNERSLTQRELTEVDLAQPGRRTLVRSSDPWACVRDGVVVPLLGNGSAVLVVSEDPDRLARIMTDERVDPGPD